MIHNVPVYGARQPTYPSPHISPRSREERHSRRVELLHQVQHLLEVVESELLLAALRERARGLDDVLDLAPVDLLLAERVQLVVREPTVRDVPVDALEEGDPDLALRVRGQILVPQRDVDARLERLVEDADAVRRQEEDPAEVPGAWKWYRVQVSGKFASRLGSGHVLELPEEHRDHGIALQVRERALLQEHVCLVDQDDRAPDRAHLEDAGKVVVQGFGMRAEVCCSYHVQGLWKRVTDDVSTAAAPRPRTSRERAIFRDTHFARLYGERRSGTGE